MRGDHAHHPSAARAKRSGLTGADTRLAVHPQVFGIRHEVAGLDVRRDDPAAGAQRGAAGAAGRIDTHPFPELCRLRIESAKCQQAKLARLASFGIEHLHAREVRAHDRHGGVHDLLVQRRGVRFLNHLRAEVLQQLGVRQLCFDLRAALAKLVFGFPAFRGFGARTEHSSDPAGFVANRRIGEGEPGLLVVALPVHHKRQVFAIIGLARQRGIDERADVGPDFRPDVVEARTERKRMLGAENFRVGIVVEQPQVLSPGHEHREFRMQQEGDDRTQRLRPGLGRAQRGVRPVVAAHERTHPAAAFQKGAVPRHVC